MANFLWFSASYVFVFGGIIWLFLFLERSGALKAALKEDKEGRDDGEFLIYERKKIIEITVRFCWLLLTLILFIMSSYFYYQPLVCKV